jgi:hypothetical protein
MSWICDGFPCELVEECRSDPIVGEGIEHGAHGRDSQKADETERPETKEWKVHKCYTNAGPVACSPSPLL